MTISSEDISLVNQMETYFVSTAQEIGRYLVFSESFNDFSDNPVDLRTKLREVAIVTTRVNNIAAEYHNFVFRVRRYLSISEEELQAARAPILLALAPSERKGYDKEERIYLANTRLQGGELEKFKFWQDKELLFSDYVRMVEQRKKELTAISKNIHEQIQSLAIERRLHGAVDWAGKLNTPNKQEE